MLNRNHWSEFNSVVACGWDNVHFSIWKELILSGSWKMVILPNCSAESEYWTLQKIY